MTRHGPIGGGSHSSLATATRVQVAERLRDVARLLPDQTAVAVPGGSDVAGRHSYSTCTFRQLDSDADAVARGLLAMGVGQGDRIVLLVRPGIEFVTLVFALLRSGAATVLIDPGMPRRHLVHCLAGVDPAGFVAISRAQAVRIAFRKRFPSARRNVTVGRRWFWGGPTYRQLLRQGRLSDLPLPLVSEKDPAAVIFTSGSTGPPKGVLYTHRMFAAQATAIQERYGIGMGGADLSCFALFGLFNSVMGVTTVFPQINFARPASARPQKVLEAANDWQVTQAFASPAVWDKLSRYCLATGERVPTLRNVFSCGAPVPAAVLARTLRCIHPEARMHTPYGATEGLPVSTIEAKEVIGETATATAAGRGVCVGRKFLTIEWRIIRISDDPIAALGDAAPLPPFAIGELIVKGPQISPRYAWSDSGGQRDVDANRLSKIAEGEDVWHRMGDVGYVDDEERFWYCGRKADRVETVQGTRFSLAFEGIVDALRGVRRSALVGVGPAGRKELAIVVELDRDPLDGDRADRGVTERSPADRGPADRSPTGRGRREPPLTVAALRRAAAQHAQLAEVAHWLIHPGLPVDVRHNSKIDRDQLAAWAAQQLGRAIDPQAARDAALGS